MAVESKYETEIRYVMGGSRRVLVNLLESSFLRWILITHISKSVDVGKSHIPQKKAINSGK